MNFTIVSLLIASALMGVVVFFSRSNMPDMRTVHENNRPYQIRSKSGSRLVEGAALRAMVERVGNWTEVYTLLLPLFLACMLLALKWELTAAIAAAAVTGLAHLLLVYRLGPAEYWLINGLVFVIAVPPLFPLAYLAYMRYFGLTANPPPDA